MKFVHYLHLSACCLLLSASLFAQDGGRISGSLEANGNFFMRDSLIGAANTPQYDRQKYGADAWLNLNYSNWGFDFAARFDVFNNSNLLNPTGSYTDQGLGMWYVRKRIDKLGIWAGYIYDHIGSGIIFRAFKQRPLLIDNALVGLRLDYQLGENWNVKAFTGRQKQQFDTYDSVIKGLAIEGYVTGDSTSRWSIAPGFGIEIMSLTATLAEPLPLRQAASSLIEEGAPDLSGLIDTLANRVGARAVYRFAPVASDVPERSVRRLPALAEDTGAGWPDHWPRPSRLLSRPEPIETMALLPDHPPNWFSWKGVRRRVRRADGPERIFGEWWKRDAELIAVRDYFRVEDDAGERFWIFRSGDGEDAATGSHRWFLHGIFG